jgi:hypothetical protein
MEDMKSRRRLALILAIAVVLPTLVAASLPALAADATPIPATPAPASTIIAVTPALSAAALPATPSVAATSLANPTLAMTATKAAAATTGVAVALAATPVYPLRIDVGGKGYRDATTGATWQADQQYSSATGWGYFGPRSMQVIAVSRPVAGTVFSPVYQTQRLGATGYRFDATDGQYRVTVRLAELYVEIGPGANVFTINCQSAPVASSVDVVKAVGRYRAYDVSFTCTAARGSLQIAFVPAKGWAAIAGLDVESAADVTAAQTPGQAGTTTPLTSAVTTTVTTAAAITATATVTIATSASVTVAPTLVVTATKAPTVTATITATAPATTSVSATGTLPVTATAAATRLVTATVAPQLTPAPLPPTSTLAVTATVAAKPSDTATVAPSRTPSASPTTPPAPLPTSAPGTATAAPVPSTTLVATPVAEATEAPAPPGMQRMSRDGFSVVFNEPDRQGAADVLDALSAIKRRLSDEVGLATAPVEIRLFPDRQAYNEALGTTAPADQVGNVADSGHVWLLAPRADNPTERDDILKGAQVEIARLALSQVANMPAWLREGVASYEGRLWNDARQQYLKNIVAMRRITSLRGLDGASYNYAGGAVTAHTVVDYLVKTYGTSQLTRLVDALKTETLDQALQETLGASYVEVDRGWLQYLSQTFAK